MANQFLGQITPFPFNFAPKGWLMCNGQLLAINTNQALFSLLGTTYGGNGISTFAVPNLQGQCAIHFGTSPGGSSYNQGQVGGEAFHTISSSEMPLHNHTSLASATTGNATSPISNFPAAATNNPYASGVSSPVAFNTSTYGGSQPHENRQPFLVLNFCIATSGIFPTRN